MQRKHQPHLESFAALLAALALCHGDPALAQETQSDAATSAQSPEPSLTPDPADSTKPWPGLSLEVKWTNAFQGVVKGGQKRSFELGGNAELIALADLGEWGLPIGGTLNFLGESRYGETANDDSGSFTPVNTRGSYPLHDDPDGEIPFTIAELSYSLSIADSLDITLGKFLTAEGDPVEFAGGVGRTQFMNSNFNYNEVTSLTAPYSTLGLALDWAPASWISVWSALFQTSDSSTTTGLNLFDNGLTWAAEVDTQYRLGSLPGGANVGLQYAFDNEFVVVGGGLTLTPDGFAIKTASRSWGVYSGAWQYLFVLDESESEIDAADAHADRRGLGVFMRFGVADPDSNLVEWSGSIGLGGRGLVPGRENDTLGVGFYHTELQRPRLLALLGAPSSTQGLEAYYNLALTSAIGLTIDAQWVEDGAIELDPARLLGFRCHVTF